MTQLLVDGNGLCCRLWWAHLADVPQRFLNTIGAVARKHMDRALEPFSDDGGPVDTIVAWDSPGDTWRRDLCPTYKAKRPPKPQALVEALAACRNLKNFRHVSARGFEADDVIATLARHTHDALILSSDKDLAQLVNGYCRMMNWDGEIIDAAAIEARFGVPPSRMRHLLSWWGDSSDGLPGVRGVGHKKAIPHALAGEVGDAMTYELVGLATVPDALIGLAAELERERIEHEGAGGER